MGLPIWVAPIVALLEAFEPPVAPFVNAALQEYYQSQQPRDWSQTQTFTIPPTPGSEHTHQGYWTGNITWIPGQLPTP